ncbi:hypothetical protein SPRA44_390032 [Serratia proteamaculans]|nr:hypothetical protein SPRA44_390032 [Serratia proteamaculans]
MLSLFRLIYLIPIFNNFILHEYLIHNLMVVIYLINIKGIGYFQAEKQLIHSGEKFT